MLVYDLYTNGIHVTGTINCTRSGVPSQISILRKEMMCKLVCQGNGGYVRDGVCAYAVWKDTNCVTIVSNEHPGHSMNTVTRNVKNKEGKNEKKEVPIPATVYNYNCYMNGVDRSDQLINYYNILKQTKKYWKTLSLHFVDIAIVNSYGYCVQIQLSKTHESLQLSGNPSETALSY